MHSKTSNHFERRVHATAAQLHCRYSLVRGQNGYVVGQRKTAKNFFECVKKHAANIYEGELNNLIQRTLNSIMLLGPVFRLSRRY
jgi:hypothetical protein